MQPLSVCRSNLPSVESGTNFPLQRWPLSWAASISCLDRIGVLKLAPLCIGGYSIADYCQLLNLLLDEHEAP